MGRDIVQRAQLVFQVTSKYPYLNLDSIPAILNMSELQRKKIKQYKLFMFN